MYFIFCWGINPRLGSVVEYAHSLGFSKISILWFCVCVQCVQVQAYMWSPEGNFCESIPFSHRGFRGLNSGCQAFVASTFTCWEICWAHSILDSFQNALNSLDKQSWKTTIEQKVWLSHASPLAVLTTTDLLQLILYFVFLCCRTGLSLCFEEQSVVGLEGFSEVTPDVFGVLFRHLIYSFSCISCL